MAEPRLPQRLIICVDGTWCTADGPHGQGYGNTSNTYRVCASVETGECFDPIAKRQIYQRKLYYEGVGSADDPKSFRRLMAGIRGDGYKDRIKDVYQKCCELNEDDEIWLYGFSRGAWIVRAVAGLLHFLGALDSAGSSQFDKEYDHALKFYTKSNERTRIGPGQLHSFLSLNTRPKARIQFVGCFDTVKAVDDGSLHDISINDSILHMRHALALCEDRAAMTPEYLFPTLGDKRKRAGERSMIQAWFAGSHIDIGGSARKDGLSLYPLQWMLSESQSKGLVLGFSQVHQGIPNARIDNPIEVVFPVDGDDTRGIGPCSYTAENGLKITMEDLRQVHMPSKYGGKYEVMNNISKNSMWIRSPRQVFADGNLRGWVPFAAEGTTIHPSVYQFLDTGTFPYSLKRSMQLRENLRMWSAKILRQEDGKPAVGFWNDHRAPDREPLNLIRILVIGNTGVGKSTLINRVFGVPVTETSHQEQGRHNIEDGLKHTDKPNLIIHDSGGFEAGNTDQVERVERFVQTKAERVEPEERIHVIWFCIDMSSDRVKQLALEQVFKKISKHAADIPIVLVGTKTDKYHGALFQAAREELEDLNQEMTELMKACDSRASDGVVEKLNGIQMQLEEEVEGGECTAAVAVRCSPKNNQKDRESIDELNARTLDCFNEERVRIIYIAAQVANLDLKIDLAILETMRIYKRLLRTVTSLAAFPMTATTNRTAAGIAICHAVLQCFGLPTVSSKFVWELIKGTVWSDIGNNVAVVAAEIIAAAGVFVTVSSGGMVPLSVLSAGVNVALVVPATTRLILMLATDLILILTGAFRQTAFTGIGQPLRKDVEAAADKYRTVAPLVHLKVLSIIRKRDTVKAFRYATVQKELEDVVHHYKQELTEGVQESSTNSAIFRGRGKASSNGSSTNVETLADEEGEKDVEIQLQEDLEDMQKLKLG